MRVQPTLDLNPQVQSNLGNFIQMFRGKWESITRIINGGISFGDGISASNIDLVWKAVTTPGTANTDFTVTHNLGRLPVGYVIATKSAACDVYNGSVASTTTTITLKATATGVTLHLLVF